MESLLALVVGLMFGSALFLMLSGILVRFVFGFVLMGNAVNLLIFASGRLTHVNPPLIGFDQTIPGAPVANALPQALILTAIVIGFAMTIFLLVLLYRAYDQARTLDADQEPFLVEMPETSDQQVSEKKEQA
ncbi:MAG: NADH-quinone oxidoreductase subunit K [Desulfotignum sp.]|nr:NADH-quinone oxidoreductase subunit K [Desulfobacteraceae bacterium]